MFAHTFAGRNSKATQHGTKTYHTPFVPCAVSATSSFFAWLRWWYVRHKGRRRLDLLCLLIRPTEVLGCSNLTDVNRVSTIFLQPQNPPPRPESLTARQRKGLGEVELALSRQQAAQVVDRCERVGVITSLSNNFQARI